MLRTTGSYGQVIETAAAAAAAAAAVPMMEWSVELCTVPQLITMCTNNIRHCHDNRIITSLSSHSHTAPTFCKLVHKLLRLR